MKLSKLVPCSGKCEVPLQPVAFRPIFDQQVRLAESVHAFPSAVPLMERMPVWITTCLWLSVHNRMSYGRKEAWTGNKYLVGTERLLARTRPGCALCQIRVEIIAQISAQGGEGRLWSNACNSYVMQFKPFHNCILQPITLLSVANGGYMVAYSSLPVSDSCKPRLSLLMYFAIWCANRSDKSPQVQKGRKRHYLLLLMRRGICLFTTPLCVLT